MARRSHHGRHPGRHRRSATGAGGTPPQSPALDVASPAAQQPAPPAPPAAADAAAVGPTGAGGAGDDQLRSIGGPPLPQPPSTPGLSAPASVSAGATASQLRRFIRSRPYVPLHELRRRFALNGGADEMAGIEVNGQRLWVGLPQREGQLLGDLLRGGDIGYELSVDPVTPVIVGVYALKSIPRP